MAGRYKKLQAQREQLDLDVDAAWNQFLGDFNQKQSNFQRAVQRRQGRWGASSSATWRSGGVSHGAATEAAASGSSGPRASQSLTKEGGGGGV